MKNITKNWDIFDILFAHEDSYTNLLQYLFENSEEFKDNLSEFLFDEKLKDLVFLTRKAYNFQNGKKRNIPDIIVYDKDHFAIIEVKVYASEGEHQTIRYYECKEEIKSDRKINFNAKERYLYLTLYKTEASCKEFESITWSDIGRLLPTELTHDEMLDMLIKQLRTRIESLDGREISLQECWHDAVKTKYWGGAIALRDTLKLLPSFKNMEVYKDDFWANYEKSKNKCTYSAIFLPYKEWRGLAIEDVRVDNEKHRCYDFHFEFKWDERQGVLETRLDYHLNPYLSKKDIGNLDDNMQQRAIDCNEFRQKVAKKSKSKWQAPEGWENCYNHRLTDNIMTLINKTIKIKEDMLVKDVLEEIEPFIQSAIEFVNTVLLPKHISES